MTPVTITPEPCGRVLRVITSFLGQHDEERCGDPSRYHENGMRCPTCTTLGDRLKDALYDDSWSWRGALAANLALASLLCRAAERAVHDYLTPVVTIHAADVPAEELRRRIEAMERACSTQIMFDPGSL